MEIEGRIFLENDQLKLSDISDIPFPDALHLYGQALKGFGFLYDELGAFGPE